MFNNKVINIIQMVAVSVVLLCAVFTLCVSFFELCQIDVNIKNVLGDFSSQINLAFSYLFSFAIGLRFFCLLILCGLLAWLLFVSIRNLQRKNNREVWSLITFGVAVILAGWALLSVLHFISLGEVLISLISSLILLIIFSFLAYKEFMAVLKKG